MQAQDELDMMIFHEFEDDLSCDILDMVEGLIPANPSDADILSNNSQGTGTGRSQGCCSLMDNPLPSKNSKSDYLLHRDIPKKTDEKSSSKRASLLSPFSLSLPHNIDDMATNNFSGIFDFPPATLALNKSTGSTSNPLVSGKGDYTAATAVKQKNSRKRRLPLENVANTNYTTKPITHVKEEMRSQPSGVKDCGQGCLSNATMPPMLNAKDEMLLKSLLGNTHLSMSDDDDNDFGDDDDFDNDLGVNFPSK